MTKEELIKRFPNASESFIAQNCSTGIRPNQPQQTQGCPLDSAPKREATGGGSVEGRFKITFRVCSVRPMDYDNASIKQAQDCIVQAGLLPDDNWKVLQGETISEKADQQINERTEITITQL